MYCQQMNLSYLKTWDTWITSLATRAWTTLEKLLTGLYDKSILLLLKCIAFDTKFSDKYIFS